MQKFGHCTSFKQRIFYFAWSLSKFYVSGIVLSINVMRRELSKNNTGVYLYEKECRNRSHISRNDCLDTADSIMETNQNS